MLRQLLPEPINRLHQVLRKASAPNGKGYMGSGTSHKRGNQFNCSEKQSVIDKEDVICPICLDFPHNAVLLHCSSYDKGCRPFMCDTSPAHSNCLDRFKAAHGLPAKESSTNPNPTPGNNIQATCPLCRGAVTGWAVLAEARGFWNSKKRCCEERKCLYIGDFSELEAHAQEEHPHARPSEIDPARKLDWENFQQSSEIIDVLSTIHSEVPHGVVLGDYIIEYGDESGDEYEDFPGDEGNWWTSCILYQVFDNFRTSRNRRRTRRSRRGDGSNFDEGSVEIDRYEESDDEFAGGGETSSSANHSHSYRRRRSRFHEQ